MITIGKKRKGARRNPNYKRPTKRWDFFMLWMRRFGFALGAFIFVVWAGAWLYLSGAINSAADWSYHKTIEMSVDAGFHVDNILVEGRVNTDPDVLLGLVNVQKGDPLFSFYPQSAKELIERISWVKSVQVERRLPDTIYIGLEERAPLALWQSDNKLYLIDAQGAVLTDYGLNRFSGLVMVSGQGSKDNAAELLRILQAEPKILERIESARFIAKRRWNLETGDGVQIKLPAEDVGLALRRLALMEDDKAILGKSLEHIDLRKSDRVIVQTAPGKVQEFSVDNFLKAAHSGGDDI
mgnify:CR=1 FL=1